MIAFGISEKGKYRKENQDSILVKTEKESGLLIVADGVGSVQSGAEASQYIVKRYGEWWDEQLLFLWEKTFDSLFDSIKDLAEEINEKLCVQYGLGKSCSTMALLFIHHSIYGYISVGDSRIYRNHLLVSKCITRDDIWDNLPEVNLKSGHSGKLISAVGGYRQLEYSCMTNYSKKGMVFLLCSDGIYRYARENRIKCSMIRAACSFIYDKRYLEEIVKDAVIHDTKDNYSAIMVKI